MRYKQVNSRKMGFLLGLLFWAAVVHGVPDTSTDLLPAAYSLLQRYSNGSESALAALATGAAGGDRHAIMATLDTMLDDVERKISNSIIAERAKKQVADKEVMARFQDHSADSQAKVDHAVEKLDESSANNVTGNLKILSRQGAELSLAKAEGAMSLATKWNKTVHGRIEKTRVQRQQHLDKMLWMQLSVLSREVEVVNFVKYLVDGGRSVAELPPSLKRGLYCELAPYANNTFEIDSASRNGARLILGHQKGSCVNWKRVGGADTTCCQVPSSTVHSSHAPWCWVSETEYAYCWDEGLPPYATGWASPTLMPLEDHFTPAFANSTINDCGKDCFDEVVGAITKDQCLGSCFRNDLCVGATLGPRGCFTASAYA